MRNRLHSVILISIIAISTRADSGFQRSLWDIPDTPEVSEVITVLERAVELLDIPFEQLDLNQLAEVLMNDSAYENNYRQRS